MSCTCTRRDFIRKGSVSALGLAAGARVIRSCGGQGNGIQRIGSTRIQMVQHQ